MDLSVCGPACSRVVSFGCVFIAARPDRLGSTLGPGVVLCWPALLEPFVLP